MLLLCSTFARPWARAADGHKSPIPPPYPTSITINHIHSKLESLCTAQVNYGLGIGTRIKNKIITYIHGGSEPGYETLFNYSPTTNETIVYFYTGGALPGADTNFISGEADITIFGDAYENELQRELIIMH